MGRIVVKRIVSAFVILLGLVAPAWAGFDEGLAAYRRGDLFEKHRLMMQAWAGYLTMRENELSVVKFAKR